MKPIEIAISGHIRKPSDEICAEFLKLERWSEFKGYLFLPGIRNAEIVRQTPGIVGTRIKVHNSDGSTHTEEIIEWDVERRIALRFGNFQPPLENLATHFIETWHFKRAGDGTDVTRTMAMYPKSFWARLMLGPISLLMKKSLERNVKQLS